MMAYVNEARTATIGVFRLLAFRDDWRTYFDISTGGVIRSFSGILLALPAFIFTVYSISYFVAENPGVVAEGATMTLSEAALTWARYWLVFPVVAAATCMAAGLSGRYAGWLVAHNWTVFVMVHLQALIFALYPAGLADPAALSQLSLMYIFVRMLAFWRAAHGALEVTPLFAAALAGIPFAVDWGLRALTQG